MNEFEKQPVQQADSDMEKVAGGFDLREEDQPCPKCGKLARVRFVQIDFETEKQWHCFNCGFSDTEYIER